MLVFSMFNSCSDDIVRIFVLGCDHGLVKVVCVWIDLLSGLRACGENERIRGIVELCFATKRSMVVKTYLSVGSKNIYDV